MKNIIVKYIGVKNYKVSHDVTLEEIHDMFQTDLSTVPVAFAKNIVPIAYAEEE
jgi:hypothetical protein